MESESDDEVLISDPSQRAPAAVNEVPVTSPVEGCKDDGLTLLALAKPAMARNRLKRKAQAIHESARTVRPCILISTSFCCAGMEDLKYILFAATMALLPAIVSLCCLSKSVWVMYIMLLRIRLSAMNAWYCLPCFCTRPAVQGHACI